MGIAVEIIADHFNVPQFKLAHLPRHDFVLQNVFCHQIILGLVSVSTPQYGSELGELDNHMDLYTTW